MKTNNRKECIIFSVYQDKPVFDVNQRNHKRVIESLEWNDVDHKELIGSYKGVIEKAILVPINQRHFVDVICKLHNQESYIILDNERGAWFIDCKTGQKDFGGWFKETSKAIAQKQEGWTFNPQTRKYYIVEDCLLGGNITK